MSRHPNAESPPLPVEPSPPDGSSPCVEPSPWIGPALGGSPIGRAALVRWAVGSPDTRQLDDVLDRVASRAASDARGAHTRSAADRRTSPALEILLELVHRLRLARSAIVRVLDDEGSIEDAMQTTLMKVNRMISTFEGRAKFRTWLYIVARNEALMVLRRSGAPVVGLDGDSAHAAPDAGSAFSSAVVSSHRLHGLVGALPAPFDATMQLYLYEQLSYEEIAARLGVPVGTVRSRLTRARALLRPKLSEGSRVQPC